MANSIAAREAQLVQRFPVLQHVPEGQRFSIVRQAARQRVAWGPPLLALVVLLPALWLGISWMQANLGRTSFAVAAGVIGGLMVASFMQLFRYTHGTAVHRLVTR